MKRVIIESPYRGDGYRDTADNIVYLNRCLKDSMRRGEAPFASHGFYTMFLDDKVPLERDIGMAAGWAWMQVCDLVVVYTDRGISQGMKAGMQKAAEAGKTVELRQLYRQSAD